ncbi:MAG: ammonium transporter, partial [Gimesia chilikensis]
MQSGFAMVESGFNSSKNTINILFKNLMDVCAGVLVYYAVGYGLMYPGDAGNGYFGFAQFGIGEAGDPGPGVLHPQVDFLIQVAFAATAATIVSGAVAGRLKFSSYLIYSIILTGIIYPISGYWKWG